MVAGALAEAVNLTGSATAGDLPASRALAVTQALWGRTLRLRCTLASTCRATQLSARRTSPKFCVGACIHCCDDTRERLEEGRLG